MLALRLTALAAGFFLLATWILLVPAWSHMAMPTAMQPDGWAYAITCCSGKDCRAVGPQSGTGIQVAETPAGYRISTTGEVIGYGDNRIKPSPDGQWHWCSAAGSDTGRTICLYAPPAAY